jgi:hypothetical protein
MNGIPIETRDTSSLNKHMERYAQPHQSLEEYK